LYLIQNDFTILAIFLVSFLLVRSVTHDFAALSGRTTRSAFLRVHCIRGGESTVYAPCVFGNDRYQTQPQCLNSLYLLPGPFTLRACGLESQYLWPCSPSSTCLFLGIAQEVFFRCMKTYTSRPAYLAPSNVGSLAKMDSKQVVTCVVFSLRSRAR